MQSSTISNEAEPCGSSPSPSGPSASSNPQLCSRCHHDENKGWDGGKMMLMAELSKGQDSAYELLRLLRLLRQHQAADDNDSAPSFETLAKKIEYSICTCISLLINTTTSTAPDTPTAITDPIDQHHKTVKVEDSGQSSLAPAATKGRRGCYKKRRSTCETWIMDSPIQMADEHAWRKYGQKAILNATHPRSYYRCTHKNDQGCQASKQVQQISSNPTLYRTTYTGYHTCNTTQDQKPSSSPSPTPFDRPGSSLDKQKSAESSAFINFESNTGPKERGTLKDDPSSGLEFLQADDDKQYNFPAVSNYLTLLEYSTALLEQQEPSSSGQLTAAGLSSIAGGSSSASAAGSGSGSGSGYDNGDVISMVPRPASAGLDDMGQIIAGFDVSHVDQLDEIDWLEDEGCASW